MIPFLPIPRLMLTLACVGLLGLSSCSRATIIPVPIYWLSIGSSPVDAEGNDHHQSDAAIQAHGTDVGANLLVLINGNPLMHHSTSGSLVQLNQWIKPGTNTVTIRGRPDKTLYLKVALALGGEVQHVALRTTRDAQVDADEVTYEFECDFEYGLHIFEPQSQITEPHDPLKAELKTVVQDLKQRMIDRDAAYLSQVLNEGLYQWSGPAYQTPADKIALIEEAFTESFRTTEITLRNLDELKFEFGQSVVMVYSYFHDALPFEATLGTISREGVTYPLGAIYFTRDGDRWIVWQVGDLRQRPR